MPACVILKNCETFQIIKTAWCESLCDANNRNYGNRSHDLTKVFYSPDKSTKPDFSLEPSENFDATKVACYEGYVMKICDTIADAKKYIEKSRIRIPRNYRECGNENRKPRRRFALKTPIGAVYERLQIKVEEIDCLKKAIKFRNAQRDKKGIENLDPTDVNEFENLLDEDDDAMPQMVDPVNLIVDASHDEELMIVEPDILETVSGHENNTTLVCHSFDGFDEVPSIAGLKVDMIFSMEYTYIIEECGSRTYVQSNIKLSRVVVDKLKEWNKNKNDCEHDTKFVRLLLLSIFTSNVLRDHNGVAVRDLDEKKLRFTRDIFHNRVRPDITRASRFNEIVEEYCRNLFTKYQKKLTK